MHKRMEILIDAVKKHPSLWDMNSLQYKDHTQRASSWAAVAEECNLSQESAKSKWRGLRDTFIKYLKAQKRAAEQGRKKQKKYCYAERMAFMRPFMVNSRDRVCVKNQLLNLVGVEEEEDLREEEFTSPAVVYECDENMDEPPEKRYRHSSDSRNDFVVQELLRKQNAENDMDATDLLFLSYSKTLKTFSKKRQIWLKRKLADVFADAELDQVTEDETEYVTPCSTYPAALVVRESNANHGGMRDPVGCKTELD